MQVTMYPRGKRRVYEYKQGVTGPVYLSDIGEALEVRASSRLEGGFGGYDACSITFRPYGTFVGGMMRPGDHMEVTHGGTVWEGEFAEIEPGNDGTLTIVGAGYAYDLYKYPSLHMIPVSGGPDIMFPTTNLTKGFTYARESLGLAVQNVDAFPAPLPGHEESDAESSYLLGDILTATAGEEAKRWACWGRALRIRVPDPELRWQMDATETMVGIADTDYYTDVFVWALAPDAGDPQNIMGHAVDQQGLKVFDRRCVVVDYRALGTMSQTAANGHALRLLNQVKGRFMVTGTIAVGPDSGLRAAGGGAAPLYVVRAGDRMRVNELRTSTGHLMPDGGLFHIGRTEWQWASDGTESLTITPEGAPPRNFSDILAKATEPETKALYTPTA